MKLRLGEIGERGIISELTPLFSKPEHVLLGIGDDAAVLKLGENMVVATTDMIQSDTHIPPQMTPHQIGKLVVTVNYSDLAAMGAKPLGILVSMGLPPDMLEEDLISLAKGIEEMATRYGGCMLGGDTKNSPRLTLAGAALGVPYNKQVFTRGGASPGDLVGVTGQLGLGAAGLETLLRGLDPKRFGSAVKAALEPEPRLLEAELLASTGAVTAANDVSDGLAWELYEISAASGVGIEIWEEKLPIPSVVSEVAGELDIDPLELALHRGWDYELLVTLKPGKTELVQQLLEERGYKLSLIGHVTEGDVIIIHTKKDGGGEETGVLEPRGYEHLTSTSRASRLGAWKNRD